MSRPPARSRRAPPAVARRQIPVEQTQPSGTELYIEAVQRRAAAQAYAVPPHVHPAMLQLFLALSGECDVIVDEAAARLRSPCLACVPGGFAHGFAFGPDASGWVLTIPHALILNATLQRQEADFIPLLRKPFVLELAAADPTVGTLSWLMQQLHIEHSATHPGRTSALHHLLRLILIHFWRETHRARELESRLDEERRLFYEFRGLVELNFARQWPLEQYTRRLGCSRQRLSGVCRLLSNSTPNDLILRRMIEEAKRLLLFTAVPSSEVGYQLGFQDPSYFARFFKRYTGCTPGDFRRDHQVHA